MSLLPLPACLPTLFLVLLLMQASALRAEGTPAAALPALVVQALSDAGIAAENVAVLVQESAGAPPLLAYQAQHPMNPASTMKLLTTYAALELLGPAHVWRTEALVTQEPVDGRLAGHLYLRGSGDPKLNQEQLWLLLRQLRARGLRHIGGDLILDRSAFALPAHDPAAFDNEPLRPYNAGADALLTNLKSVRITLQPDLPARRVRLSSETPAEGLQLINRLQAVDAPCVDWREKVQVKVSGGRIELGGSFALACGEKTLTLSPWPANEQFERLFRALWQELGGSFAGQLREGTAPGDARLLLSHESPPLAEAVREINKFSNNVMARQLFLSLAVDRPASPEGAQGRIRQWLVEKGLEMPGLVLDNGSGLSRHERISAESLGRLLLAAWRSPVMPELMASLPVAGFDGTLKKRMEKSSVNGRAHLKTGYLEGVRSVAGYVLDRNGRRWIVVCLINDPRARYGKPAIDALLEWVAAGR